MPASPRFPNLPEDWSAREWRHCVLTTYSSWLYGDARGFRTRHHREHVDGDYRNPPPNGKFAKMAQRSREALKQPPVVLSPSKREIVGNALIERLTSLNAYILCAAVSGQHVHVLAKLPKGSTRMLLGLAKKHAWFAVRNAGHNGRLWAKRGRADKIRNKRHHANAFRYILEHAKQGAWIWIHPDVRDWKKK